MSVYENCRIYGPYIRRKDNRKIIHVIFPNGRRTTVSYPKFLMECKLDRYLGPDETVDHIDDDFTNDNIDNLQVLSRVENARKSIKKPEYGEFTCKCGKKFMSRLSQVKHNRNRGSSGPYCSKTCAGYYTYNTY